jgi:hypothetical protein
MPVQGNTFRQTETEYQMKHPTSISFAFLLAFTGAPAWAQPTGAASAPTVVPSQASAETARMDAQMRAMKEMHDKMSAPGTHGPRNSLITEHSRTMQESMNMLNDMFPGGMGSVGGTQGDPATRQQMMEKRMQMMQSMMQMIMDHVPAKAAK